MTNIYQAPEADLAESTVPFDGRGSIENGIAGKYQFSIGEVLREAWDKTNGTKGTIWLALLFYLIVLVCATGIVSFVLKIFGLPQGQNDPFGEIVKQVILLPVIMPLAAGFFMVGLKLAARAPVSATEVFAYYPKVLPLIGTTILMYLMVMIGLVLLVIPGIYLALAYSLALPLVVEKNLDPWEALETSRKALTHSWFRMFGLGLVLSLIMVVAMIPVLIGLIWVLPMAMLAFGIVYRNIFGYDGAVSK